MSRSNKFWIILCILETVIIIYLLFNRKPPSEIILDANETIDSIFIVNEKIKKEIVYIEQRYKEDSVYILSASDSMLFDSFSRYIENYNNK